MKRTSLAVLMIALALVALAAPLAYAQAPAPKVTINGLIDEVMSYTRNASNFDGIYNRNDLQWYGRTRGRFDIIGEVGKVKGVLGIELDMVYGQAGSNDSTINSAGPATGVTTVTTQPGTSGSFDLNTDSRGIFELKWLYVEFPVPLIPIPTTARLGAQPFGSAANYKLAVYANGDFPGVNIVSQITPNVKIVSTYVAVEENLVGTQTRTGLSGPLGVPNTQNRGDDFAVILSPEVTPFKGLDIKPLWSWFYAQGTTSGSARTPRGGINTSTAFTNPDGSSRGGIEENRYTVGLDARLRMGPFSFDPTVLYQFGNRGVITPGVSALCPAPCFAPSGAAAGQKRYAKLDAWLFDLREGFQLGPLLIEALQVYSTGNSARNNTLGTVRYFQPLDTDTSYLADWGTQISSLGLDYSNSPGSAAVRVGYPGNVIGWDKYGRGQLGLKATYAITPDLSIMAGANGHWTAEAVDRNATPVAGAGLVPVFADPRPRDSSHYVGTEFMTLLSYRFAPGLVWDNAAGYMIAGPALDAITDPAAGARNAKDIFIYTSRIRFTF